MNIFVLDRDPKVAAMFHCNKHVVKMILESSQMLCSAHWIYLLKEKNKDLKSFKRVKDAQSWLYENTDNSQHPPWKLTHANHPCSIWTRETVCNYMWHLSLAKSLLSEYTKRYQKYHKSEVVVEWLSENFPLNIPDDALTEFPQCVPDDCKVPGNAPIAYQKYYVEYKNHFAKWEPKAITPGWYREALK